MDGLDDLGVVDALQIWMTIRRHTFASHRSRVSTPELVRREALADPSRRARPTPGRAQPPEETGGVLRRPRAATSAWLRHSVGAAHECSSARIASVGSGGGAREAMACAFHAKQAPRGGEHERRGTFLHPRMCRSALASAPNDGPRLPTPTAPRRFEAGRHCDQRLGLPRE
jgi:hypothetical protein